MQRSAAALADALPPRLAALAAALAGAGARTFVADRGATLAVAGRPLDFVHLVERGIVATLARGADGAAAETGLVGPGGLVGYAAALGAATATADAVALTRVSGLAAEPTALARLAATDRAVGRELMAYALWRIAELERLCACAATHSVERRLARWLSGAAQLTGGQPIAVTHDQLARLFGVRRASVTVGLHVLEGEQAVRCRRGVVEIRDPTRLEAASCGCHRAAGPTRTGGR